MRTWRQVFTPKFTLLVLVEGLGFGAATALLFTSVPLWVAAVLAGATGSVAVIAATEIATGRLK